MASTTCGARCGERVGRAGGSTTSMARAPGADSASPRVARRPARRPGRWTQIVPEARPDRRRLRRGRARRTRCRCLRPRASSVSRVDLPEPAGATSRVDAAAGRRPRAACSRRSRGTCPVRGRGGSIFVTSAAAASIAGQSLSEAVRPGRTRDRDEARSSRWPRRSERLVKHGLARGGNVRLRRLDFDAQRSSSSPVVAAGSARRPRSAFSTRERPSSSPVGGRRCSMLARRQLDRR